LCANAERWEATRPNLDSDPDPDLDPDPDRDRDLDLDLDPDLDLDLDLDPDPDPDPDPDLRGRTTRTIFSASQVPFGDALYVRPGHRL
jgi:hypothetical protein